MDVRQHPKNSEELTKTVDVRGCRRIRTREYEWESRILVDNNEEVTLPVIRRERGPLKSTLRRSKGCVALIRWASSGTEVCIPRKLHTTITRRTSSRENGRLRDLTKCAVPGCIEIHEYSAVRDRLGTWRSIVFSREHRRERFPSLGDTQYRNRSMKVPPASA